MGDLETLVTEQRSSSTRGIDSLETLEAVSLLIRDQRTVMDVVEAAAPAIAAAVDLASPKLREGGRLVYTGSGTSGRLAEADAAELPPTFGFDSARLAVVRLPLAAADDEGEDDAEAGHERTRALGLTEDDVLVAVAASGRTPFVLGCVEAARRDGCATIAVISNPATPLAARCDLAIELVVGPEPIAGSTRMKAGLAQRFVLTTFSTALMVRLGRTFDNLMVEVPPVLEKLRERRIRIVAEACQVSLADAERLVHAAGEDVKRAIVVELARVDSTVASDALAKCGGVVRAALDLLSRPR